MLLCVRQFDLLLILIGAMFVGVVAAGCGSSGELTSTADLMWPPPPELPRIKYVRTLSDRNSVEGSGMRWLDALAGETPKDRLVKPYGVAAGRNGKVYVTDSGDRRIFVFDTKNERLSFIGTVATGPVVLPLGIAADTAGFVYVADSKLKSVMVYGEDGHLAMAIGGSRRFENPVGVALDETRRRLYVVDSQAHDVKVFSFHGTFLFSFGGRGSGDGKFNYPTNCVVDQNGNIYVVETVNARVQAFDPDGKFLWKFGSLGDAFGQFTRPKGIALDSQGNIYVVDAAFNNFQVFDPRGTLLLFVGALGKEPGMFWLPAGACIDLQDRIYVVDQMNQRVQVFQYLK